MPSEVSTVSGDQSAEELNRELAEAREQQAATAEILKVISSSPTDLHRVMTTVAHNAAHVCGANDAQVYRVEDGALRIVASYGTVGVTASMRVHGVPLTRATVSGRAFLDRQSIHVADLAAVLETDFPDSRSYQEELGFRTTLATPLLSKNIPIGVILIRRMAVDPFSNKQIAMLETFADQAVIAIENARLFEAEQTRTRELTERTHELMEALEYQTATSDVLAVISRSKFDLQPTLDAIAGTASRLCGAADVTIFLRDGGDLRSTAHHGHMSMAFPYVRQPIGRDWVAGRTVLDRKPIHVHDLFTAGEDLSRGREIAALAGHRTTLGIPLLREGAAIGCIVLRRAVVKPFAEKQITILQTFADQAVIAIENTRLFEAEQASKRELAESLEEQTATSEVLQVISSSAGELLPVFAAILKNAVQICGAEYGQMFLFEEGSFRAVATHDLPRAWAELLARSPPIPADPKLPLGRLAATKRVVEVADLRTEQGYINRYPTLVGLVEVGGARTLLIVPMLKENALVGAIGIHCQEVRPFTEARGAAVARHHRPSL